MGLDLLVREVGQALGDARRLFGPTPVPGGFGADSGLGGGRDAVSQAGGAPAQTWGGASGPTYVAASGGQVTALDSVIGADQGTTTGLGGSADAAAAGRGGMDAVLDNTRAGVAAIAPSAGTPAGKQALVTHLQGQLQRAKVLLQVSEQRNIALAGMIRNAATGYRGGFGGAAMMPGAAPGGLALPLSARLTGLRPAHLVAHTRPAGHPHTPPPRLARAGRQSRSSEVHLRGRTCARVFAGRGDRHRRLLHRRERPGTDHLRWPSRRARGGRHRHWTLPRKTPFRRGRRHRPRPALHRRRQRRGVPEQPRTASRGRGHFPATPRHQLGRTDVYGRICRDGATRGAGTTVSRGGLTMSLGELVTETGQALRDARGLYGPAPADGAWSSTGRLSTGREGVAAAGRAAAAGWGGAGANAYGGANNGQLWALDNTVGADNGTAPPVTAAGQAATTGGEAMDGVITDTRSGVAAIAPSTGTPAGKQALVTHLQGQLDRAKALLRVSEQRNAELAGMIARGSGGYGAAGASPMGGAGMPMGGGMQGAGGGGMGGGGGGLITPALSALTSLTRHHGHHPESLNVDDHAIGGGSPAARMAVKAALSKLGRPYVWGGRGPDAFDCSGLVRWSYAQAGVTLGDDTYAQIHQGAPVAHGDVQAGDLVFPNAGHVMLAISPTECVEAQQSGVPVKVSPMPGSYVARRPTM